MRVAKTEEVIETQIEPAEKDPRHKGARMTHAHVHAHAHAHTLTRSVLVQETEVLTDKTARGMCWRRHPHLLVNSFPRSQ